MANVGEPFTPPRDRTLSHVARLSGTDHAVVMIRSRNGPSRIYEAHALTEPFSELRDRLTREGHGRYFEGAVAEEKARQDTADRIGSLSPLGSTAGGICEIAPWPSNQVRLTDAMLAPPSIAFAASDRGISPFTVGAMTLTPARRGPSSRRGACRTLPVP